MMLGKRICVAFAVVILVATGPGHAAKKQTSDAFVVTGAELQLDLMSYGDRYAAVAAQVVDDVERLEVPSETRRAMLGDLVFSAAAAFTIAADPDPQLALLDMVVMTTLGRMVYEDYWRPRLGPPADLAIAAFIKLESDVWEVATPILNEGQQNELRERITTFHRDNPELSTFSHLRFADFPSKRAESTLKKTKSGGIFASVRNISDQVEETRIMAERAMYLSTRLPLLTGGFADIWVSRLSANPAIEEFRQDVHDFALVSDRLATVAEQLPEQVATERNDTIEQLTKEVTTLRYEAIEHLLQGFAKERQETLRQFIAEEERLGGLLTELRHTLEEANTLALSADALAERFDDGDPSAKPFYIEDYRRAIVDAGTVVEQLNSLVRSTDELLSSQGADLLVPGLIEAIDEAGQTSEDLVDHSFLRAALLILFALVGYVLARLSYRWLAERFFGSDA